MFQTDEEFGKILRGLREVMKDEAIDKVRSLIYSLYRENEDLRKSRDKWREKCKLGMMTGNKKS